MHSQITVIRRAVETQIDAEWYGRPCWVFCTAVEAYLSMVSADSQISPTEPYLVCRLCFQFLKQLLRLGFGSERHGEFARRFVCGFLEL